MKFSQEPSTPKVSLSQNNPQLNKTKCFKNCDFLGLRNWLTLCLAQQV